MADVKISELTALTSPDGAEELVVNDGGTTKKITLNNLFNKSIDVTGTVTADGLVVAQPSGANILLESTTGGATAGDIFGEIEFKTNDSSSAGIKGKIDSYSEGNVGNGALRFHTGNTTELAERMRIDSSGNVLVGKNSLAISVEGITFEKGGAAEFTTDASRVMRLNRTTDDGSILELNKDGTTVGSIGTASSYMVIGSPFNGGAHLLMGNNLIHPATSTGGAKDNLIDLGGSTNRFKDLYLSGQVNTGTVVTTGHVKAADGYSIGWGDLTTRFTGNSAGDFITATTAGTERMRVNSVGEVLIGTTSHQVSVSSGIGGIFLGKPGGFIGAASSGVCMYQNRIGSSGTLTEFRINGTIAGSVYGTTGSVSYNTSSDYRLKENIVPMIGATERLKALKPSRFNFITNPERTVDGFLAHEAQEVVPECVTGSKDAMKDEEYEVSPATGDVFTAGSEGVEAIMSERNVTETVETGSYVNLAGDTIVETAEQTVTTEVTSTEVQRQDIDGVSTEVEVEVINQVPVTEAYESSPAIAAVAEIIHSSDVENPTDLEEGQQWRETTAQVMATRSVPDMQGIDQAKVVPLMIATIQELITRIEALEA